MRKVKRQGGQANDSMDMLRRNTRPAGLDKRKQMVENRLAAWKARSDERAKNKAVLIAPDKLNVIGDCGGFTALTKGGNTLWRPASVLKKGTVGMLVGWDSNSFFQGNDNAILGYYRVAGYNYLVCAWFDKHTKRRIA